MASTARHCILATDLHGCGVCPAHSVVSVSLQSPILNFLPVHRDQGFIHDYLCWKLETGECRESIWEVEEIGNRWLTFSLWKPSFTCQ